MKRLVVMLLVLVFVGIGVAIAADTVTYETKQGNVTFNHKAHGEKLKCDACHKGTPAKIEVTKDLAHGALCKDCHKAQSGPTKCGDCHKK
jgi:c(7)-type cytochrome triheme protein